MWFFEMMDEIFCITRCLLDVNVEVISLPSVNPLNLACREIGGEVIV
jgi:hypothetical protein